MKVIKIEDRCVGCPPEMGCLGSSCPNKHVEVLVCDRCGTDYRVKEGIGPNGEDLCIICTSKIK